MKQYPVAFLKTHQVRKDGPLAIIIPKSVRIHLKIQKGDILTCYYGGGGKIIYVKRRTIEVVQ